LDVGIDGLFFEAAGSKIDDFNTRFIRLFEKDVFWFQIGMDYLVFVEEVDCVEDL
jgi:hypothetical protein